MKHASDILKAVLYIAWIIAVLIILFALVACKSPAVYVEQPTEDCYAPWEHEPYKSGRAIPAPGPDATVKTCEEEYDKARH